AGSVTSDMLDYVRGHSDTQGVSRLESLTFDVNASMGNLPGGMAELAMGIEYRHEHLRTRPDSLLRDSGTVGGANFTATDGERDIGEWYGEVLLPLVGRRPGVEALNLELAGRVSHYSDFGWTSNPKVGVLYKARSDLALRASYSEGFRAPTLEQLYIGQAVVPLRVTSMPCQGARCLRTLRSCSSSRLRAAIKICGRRRREAIARDSSGSPSGSGEFV
ncbi:MAG: TonB-dependent receptor, partial [Gammaproteobacteria bacterium]